MEVIRRTGTARAAQASARARTSSLSLYQEAPTEELTLTDFEQLAVDRLNVLRFIETIKAKGAKSSERTDPIMQAALKHGLTNPRNDKTSHFILRLVFCRSEELRRWFITHEVDLFRARFQSNVDDVKLFFAENNLDYEPLQATDFDYDLRQQIASAALGDKQDTEYYKVDFEEALDLVARRAVFLKEGYAFVSRTNLVSIVANKFRTHLSKELAATYRASQNIRQDKRIVPLVVALGKQRDMGPSYKAGKFTGNLTKEQIPGLVERGSFPLCMSTLYQGLKTDFHLKHGGRMQFGLFLKGAGLSLQEALDFWRAMFARKTPPDKFNKEYAYNIRHNYGKEGKRTQYTPYGCMKIIQSQPGPGDHHGCPFRHFEEAHMRTKLRERKLAAAQIEDVITLIKGNHYQIACQRVFQYTHGNKVPENVGNHPNAYFDASIKYYRDLEGGEKKAITDGSEAKAIKEEPGAAGAGAATPKQLAAPAAVAVKSEKGAGSGSGSGPVPMDTS